jgi:hypothetical protein
MLLGIIVVDFDVIDQQLVDLSFSLPAPSW